MTNLRFYETQKLIIFFGEIFNFFNFIQLLFCIILFISKRSLPQRMAVKRGKRSIWACIDHTYTKMVPFI